MSTFYSPNGTRLYDRSDLYVLAPAITYKCNATCDNCSSLCGSDQAPSNEDIKLEVLEQLISDSIELNHKWKLIELTGGEPTMHPQFKDIVLMFEAYKQNHNQELVLTVVTNGYSKKTKELIIFAEEHQFEIRNSFKSDAIMKKTEKYDYIPINISPLDVKYKVEQISCEQGARCGMSLTNTGFWECTPSAAMARVFDIQPICKSLVDLTEEGIYRNMERDCLNCGYALFNAPRVKDQISSKTWKNAFIKYKENKVK